MIAVAAGVIRKGSRLLLCQRKCGAMDGLRWEFPGGKLEMGESPEQALERELLEELRIQTRASRILDALRICRKSDGADLLLLFYECELLSGEPETADCNALCWVLPEDALKYDLCEADAQFARRNLSGDI